MISVREAHALIEASLGDLTFETIPIGEALGRVLAEHVRASFGLPRFTNAAMDGFAVRAADVAQATLDAPARLKLVGTVRTGHAAEFSIRPGECGQVMTGAPLPAGTDAVVPVEQTNGYDMDPVEIHEPVKARANIRFEGEEIEVGTTLISPGSRVGPAEHGVLASFGFADVRVYRRPRVAVYGTGDELQEPGRPLEPGQIYNSNLHVLTDLARRVGSDIHFSGVIRDDEQALTGFLSEALDRCDVVISSGGVSMGKYDLVRRTLIRLGVKDRFWQGRQKPGKPLFFGVRGDTLVFGLPGNPVSSFICFMEYLWPTIKKMQGQPPIRKVMAKLSAPFHRDGERHRFLFGNAYADLGTIRVEPTTRVGSNMITAGLRANCILEAPPGNEALGVGDDVCIRLLPWGDLEPMERE